MSMKFTGTPVLRPLKDFMPGEQILIIDYPTGSCTVHVVKGAFSAYSVDDKTNEVAIHMDYKEEYIFNPVINTVQEDYEKRTKPQPKDLPSMFTLAKFPVCYTGMPDSIYGFDRTGQDT